MEITKQRQTAVVNPTLKGLDYLPQGQLSTGGSLNNLLDISTDSKDTGKIIRQLKQIKKFWPYYIENLDRKERHHSAGSQTLTKINQIKIEPELNKSKASHSKTISFKKRAKKEWRKIFNTK